MSIRYRFTLALTAVGLVLFGMYALLAYRSERSDLRTATIREIRIIGRSLETSLGNALRDRQKHDIDETLADLEAIEPNIDIHIHGVDGAPIAHSQHAVIDPAIEALVAHAMSSGDELVEFQPTDTPTRLVFAARLVGDDGKPLGAMAIARPTDDLDADLDRTSNRLLWLLAVFFVATVATGVLLGTLHVARPISRLLDGVRHAREGDFKAPVPAGRNDEIGELVDEFNAMLRALADARAKTETETEARTRLEQGLLRVDKLVTIGQLSAGLAHEIGSPLQVMSGRASVLLDHADPEVRRQAESLIAQCDRIARIVEQLMSFGRKKAATIAPCDLVQPVRAVIDLLAAEARKRGVKLVLETDDASHQIAADADQVQQVALNLVKNALAVTKSGGTVIVRIDRDGHLVRLGVRDTGPGIPAEAQGRVFEPFFTTRASEGGTGLGLAVVRSIANEHHAKIDLRSEPGTGAEFVVSFDAHA